LTLNEKGGYEMKARKERIYRDLQVHLNKQPVGYPATKSGVEIRLLKRFFNPEEARLAMNLNYKPRSLEDIYENVKESRMSFKDMETMLDGMMKNGVIGHMEKLGTRYFFNVPLVVGMYEGQLNTLTPEFLADFEEYTSSTAFGLEFLGTKLPQMRTIPVRKSIKPEHHVTTYDHLTSLITGSVGPFVVNECICRKAAHLKGNPCQRTTRMETCMALGDIAKNCIRAGMGRKVSKEEALDIAQQNESEGLILQPSNTQDVEFICACCGCCCGMLSVHRILPKPVDFWSTNYYASVDPESCTGCETCVERCQVDAISIEKHLGASTVNLDRCLGCGNCIPTCPSQAISLVKKEKEVSPPENWEELYDIIMANKKGRFGKIKLATRLMLKK
jgi:Na+-translocating ferredoxin:NAD+ oxidoreductase RNF subunit RnfB